MEKDFLLLMKMRQGEEAAFDKFVRKYYEEIFQYCRYHCFDREYARDLTQETFLKFFAKLPDYHYRGKTKNFLYTIAGNLCKNFYKKRKELLLEQEELEQGAVLEEDMMDGLLDQMTVEDAIKNLSQEQREVILLYYFQDLKLREIAEVLGIGLPLVKYRLGQGRKQLGEWLKTE